VKCTIIIEGRSKGLIVFSFLYFLETNNVRSELVDLIEKEIEPFTPAKTPFDAITAIIRAKDELV